MCNNPATHAFELYPRVEAVLGQVATLHIKMITGSQNISKLALAALDILVAILNIAKLNNSEHKLKALNLRYLDV